jgi:hypothetical protein
MKGNVIFRFNNDLTPLVKGRYAELNYAFNEHQSLKEMPWSRWVYRIPK